MYAQILECSRSNIQVYYLQMLHAHGTLEYVEDDIEAAWNWPLWTPEQGSHFN